MAKKSFMDNPALQFISVPEERPEQQPTAEKAPEGYKVNPAYIEKRTKRVQLVLQPSLYERLKIAADQAGISFNEYANQAFEEKLERSK